MSFSTARSESASWRSTALPSYCCGTARRRSSPASAAGACKAAKPLCWPAARPSTCSTSCRHKVFSKHAGSFGTRRSSKLSSRVAMKRGPCARRPCSGAPGGSSTIPSTAPSKRCPPTLRRFRRDCKAPDGGGVGVAVLVRHRARGPAWRNNDGGKAAQLVRRFAFRAVDDGVGGRSACHERSNAQAKTEYGGSDLRVGIDRCTHVVRHDVAPIDRPCGHPNRIERRLRFGVAIFGKVPRTVWICPDGGSRPSQDLNANNKHAVKPRLCLPRARAA